jgi:hypothetical protein
MAISTDTQETMRLREVFSTAFGVFRRHVVAFIILSAIAHIPHWLLFLFLSLWFRYVPRSMPFDALFFVLGIVAIYTMGFVCVLIAYGAIIYCVIQDFAGRRVTTAEAVTMATRYLWRPASVLVAAVAVSRWFFGGFVVLSIYWLALGMYFVAAPVFIAEQLGIGAALSRCRFLTEGRRWQIFIAILLAGIVSRAVDTIILGAIGVASMLTISIVNVSIWIVFGAFSAVFAAVFYDRLRSIKDGAPNAKVFDGAGLQSHLAR